MASKCIENQLEFYKIKENHKSICKEKNYNDNFEGRYEDCCAYYSSFGEYIYSDGTDLNEKLSQIPNTTDTLFIMNSINGLTIDFNQMNVVLGNLKESNINIRKSFFFNKEQGSINCSKFEWKHQRKSVIFIYNWWHN